MAVIKFDTEKEGVPVKVLQRPIELRLMDAACIYWDVDEDFFSKRDFKSGDMEKKKIMYYLLKEHTGYSIREIADRFGRTSREHVRQLVQEVGEQRGIYPQMNRQIAAIELLASKMEAQLELRIHSVTVDVKLDNLLTITEQQCLLHSRI